VRHPFPESSRSIHRLTELQNKEYEAELFQLQVELVKLQDWVKKTGARIVILFEGRDAAGKGGIIKRILERVSPRVFRLVALPAPTERQKTQNYAQRYIEHLPAGGEIVIFDRFTVSPTGKRCTMVSFSRGKLLEPMAAGLHSLPGGGEGAPQRVRAARGLMEKARSMMAGLGGVMGNKGAESGMSPRKQSTPSQRDTQKENAMKHRQVGVRVVAVVLGLLLLAGLSVAQSGGSMGQSIPDKMPSMSQAKDLIDINSATKEQLSSLPGIGDKYSDKIIAGRPYANKSQLVSKNIIPQGVYSKISSMIVAKQK